MLRVLIINTSEQTGGAAQAAHRLMEALNANGVEARMLVAEKLSDDQRVVALPSHWRHRLHFLWERLCLFAHLRFSRQNLFQIDMANAGTDITKTAAFRQADVIHLHWVNQGMLSLRDIERILQSGKPVVWTMHDLWPATAICHYARGCEWYHESCHHCPLLPDGGSRNDLSARVWRRKQRMLSRGRIAFVACSQWLEGEARKSALFKEQTVSNIPNPIDSSIFRPIDRQEARRQLGLPEQGRIILFVSQRVTDERKGISYLIEAIDLLVKNNPSWQENTTIAILGGQAEEVASRLAMPAHPLGYIRDAETIVRVYNAADVFVTPSLEDNLPNTIMEAMACGVPCVGFRVGGIPEMIDHQLTGYVARFADSVDLATGIDWVLNHTNRRSLSAASLQKVADSYSQASVARRYTEVYEQMIKEKGQPSC